MHGNGTGSIFSLFQQYAVRMKEIRLLSTPDLNDIKNPDEFGRILAENFSKIGKLAIENRKIINDVIRGASCVV